ncbi:MAG: CHRD domain-containing protein, partial [Actinomycetota bacterium]|nr:CHRD domain-containing protein [Actinomycetota bacterium]
HVAGGVIAFLCGGGGKPACPATHGTVEGTIRPADVIGPAAQGIAAGEFDELVRAIRAGATYANVHSGTYPAGEIRGQIRTNGKGHEDD